MRNNSEKIDSSRNWNRKVKYLGEGVDVLITNLSKMHRLLQSRSVLLSHVDFIVNDESDVFIENMKRDYEKLLAVFAQL